MMQVIVRLDKEKESERVLPNAAIDVPLPDATAPAHLPLLCRQPSAQPPHPAHSFGGGFRFYHLKEFCHLLRSTNSFEAEAGRRILLSNQYRIESLSLSHTSIIIVVFICLSIGVQS